MSGRIAVVSSVYGGYDQPLPPPPQDAEAEWVLVTDRPYDVPGWRVVVEPRTQLHPRLAAKVAKCRPDLYADADTYVWVDTSFAITSGDFVSWCVSHLEYGPIAQIPHPERNSIVDEANVSCPLPKYQGLPLCEQAEHYVKQGYPHNWGLWATGLIAYRGRSVIGDDWLREQMRFTYQDQLSEAPLLWSRDLRPVSMAGGLFNNPHFVIRGHRDHQ